MIEQLINGEAYNKEIINGIESIGPLALGVRTCEDRDSILNGEVYKPELIAGALNNCVVYDRTSDTYWTNSSNFTWGSGVWTIGASDGNITVNGTWAAGFRPSYIRVLSTDSSHELIVRDTNSDDIVDVGGYDGTWTAITFGSYNIEKIVVDDMSNGDTIRAIEFKYAYS